MSAVDSRVEKYQPRRCAESCRVAPSARRGRTRPQIVLARPCLPARDAPQTRSPYRPWSRPCPPLAHLSKRALRAPLPMERFRPARRLAAGCRRGSTWVEESEPATAALAVICHLRGPNIAGEASMSIVLTETTEKNFHRALTVSLKRQLFIAR